MKKLFVIILIILAYHNIAFALGIRPGDERDKVIAKYRSYKFGNYAAEIIIKYFGNPEHEHILQLAVDDKIKKYDTDDKENLNIVNNALLYGTRWNDNPQFILKKTRMDGCEGEYIALPHHSLCWYNIFIDGEKRSKGPERTKELGWTGTKSDEKKSYFDRDSEAVILLRSHFGDMQFLHAMASKDNETAGETKAKILMWCELMWRITTGEIKRGTDLTKTDIVGLNNLFWQGDTVQKILIPDRPDLQQDIDLVALGSLLHVVHDSFTASHTEREVSPLGTSSGDGLPDAPARIIRFLNYTMQDPKKHAAEDERKAINRHITNNLPNVVSVTNALIEMYKTNIEYIKRNKLKTNPAEREKLAYDWPTVKIYLLKVFETTDDSTVTDGGGFI